MKILVNGESKEFTEAALTVAELLKKCNVEAPEMVSVQHNGTFVDKAAYVTTQVKESDEVDFLYFMGGGA